MNEVKLQEVHQCGSCPWRVDCEPDRDIPGYRLDLHEQLTCTIRSGTESLIGDLNIMACHYSREGQEIPCAGWLENQAGRGHNFRVRLAIMEGRLPVPVVDGPQHERFEDTLR